MKNIPLESFIYQMPKTTEIIDYSLPSVSYVLKHFASCLVMIITTQRSHITQCFFVFHHWKNWNLEKLVFEVRGKPEYLEKNLSEQGREPTTNSNNRTWATLVGGDCSHHCAIVYRTLYFPFVNSLQFLTVDATIGNQAFNHDRCNIFPELSYNKENYTTT